MTSHRRDRTSQRYKRRYSRLATVSAGGSEERARTARESLRDVLTDAGQRGGGPRAILRRAARAAAYVLTVTAQSAESGEKDLPRSCWRS